MAHSDHYRLADDVIRHLNPVVPVVTDSFLASRYAGFVSVAATTVYELAIQEIFVTFAERKHAVFGSFAERHYRRLNGRIKLEQLRNEHVARFGDKYLTRFKRRSEELERRTLRTRGVSVTASYGNVVAWRHSFAHSGEIPATYDEVVAAYQLGKELINCLERCMRR
jgi:hypothetical protein